MTTNRRQTPDVSRNNCRRLSIETLETRAMLSATVRVLENINRTNPWSDIKESVAIGSDLFFVAQDPGRTNLDLWKSNGTEAGTARLVNLGPNDGKPRQLTNVNGTLFFRGYDAEEGFELWKSDGTTRGTAIVRSLKSGLGSSLLKDFTEFKGTLFFSGNGDLFKSNGVATTRVKDLIVGASDQVSILASASDALYFTSTNAGGQVSLYRTTGTSSGTTLVTMPLSTSLSDMVSVGPRLFLVRNGNELWKLEPSTTSAELVYASPAGWTLSDLVDYNGTLFFSALGNLMKSDGTSGGTEPVPNTGFLANKLFVSNNLLYFSNGTNDFGSGNGEELWRSDGTATGTFELKEINPRFHEGYGYGSYPNSFVESGGILYFLAYDGQQTGLWTTDGTSAGTTLVESAASRQPVDVAGQLFFAKPVGRDTRLQRLTLGQTTSISITRTAQGVGSSSPVATTLHDGSLYFFATDGVTGSELRRRTKDGTVELVADITAGPADTAVLDMESANGLLYISISEGPSSRALWRSDGTSTGTFKLANVLVTPNSLDVNAPKFVTVNNSVYFSAVSSDGEELWKSNGTVAGTVMVKDIFPGSAYSTEYGFQVFSSKPAYLTNLNGTLFFAASNAANGRELWKSDGTNAGTVLAVDVRPGATSYYPYEVYSSNPAGIQTVNGMLHFIASDETGVRFFESDGTVGGTTAVTQAIPGLSFVSSVKRIGDNTFFAGVATSGGSQLWTSDRTTLGTKIVKDIRQGFYNERISNMTEVDGLLYFTANDGIHGNELWKSDGTTEGTELVLDARTGLESSDPASSNPAELTAVNGVLFFTANDGTNGRTLWRTNGTLDGATRILGDGTTNVSNLVSSGSRLVFSGDSTLGRELFHLTAASPSLSFGSTALSYREGQPLKALIPDAVLTDVDSTVFSGGRLTVNIEGAVPGDQLSLLTASPVPLVGKNVQQFGVVFGELSQLSTPTMLVIDLNQNATLSRTQALLRVIGFRTLSDNPLARTRRVQFTLTDGEAGITRKQMLIDVTPVNDAPRLTGLVAVNYQRNNNAGVAFAAGGTLTDVDSVNFDGGQLVVSVTGGEAANNRIYLSGSLFTVDTAGNLLRGTVIIGSVTNSGVGAQPFSVQFNASAKPATVTQLLAALRFGTVNSNSNQVRNILLSISDGDDGTTQARVRVRVTS